MSDPKGGGSLATTSKEYSFANDPNGEDDAEHERSDGGCGDVELIHGGEGDEHSHHTAADESGNDYIDKVHPPNAGPKTSKGSKTVSKTNSRIISMQTIQIEDEAPSRAASQVPSSAFAPADCDDI